MKKRDLLVIGIVLVLALVCWLVPRRIGLLAREGDLQLKVTVKGETYGTYSLSEDQIIKINDTNVCEIKDKEVSMTKADCPDKLCMHQGPVKIQGETIVCLPNRVVLEIVSQEKGQTDGIDSIAQ